jgi:hypothetical protein
LWRVRGNLLEFPLLAKFLTKGEGGCRVPEFEDWRRMKNLRSWDVCNIFMYLFLLLLLFFLVLSLSVFRKDVAWLFTLYLNVACNGNKCYAFSKVVFLFCL